MVEIQKYNIVDCKKTYIMWIHSKQYTNIIVTNIAQQKIIIIFILVQKLI